MISGNRQQQQYIYLNLHIIFFFFHLLLLLLLSVPNIQFFLIAKKWFIFLETIFIYIVFHFCQWIYNSVLKGMKYKWDSFFFSLCLVVGWLLLFFRGAINQIFLTHSLHFFLAFLVCFFLFSKCMKYIYLIKAKMEFFLVFRYFVLGTFFSDATLRRWFLFFRCLVGFFWIGFLCMSATKGGDF